MSGIWGPPVAHRTPPHEGQVSRTGFLKPSHLAKAPRSQKGPGWETLSPRTEVHSREGLRLPTTRFAPKSPQRQDHLCLLPGDCGQPSTCSRLSLLAHPRLCTPQADFRATGKQHCLALRLPTLRPSSASEAEEQRLPPRKKSSFPEQTCCATKSGHHLNPATQETEAQRPPTTCQAPVQPTQWMTPNICPSPNPQNLWI